MLNSKVDSLGNNSVSDLFVKNNTNRVGVNVEDSSGSSVIVFVGHSLVNGTISYDVNKVSLFVVDHISR